MNPTGLEQLGPVLVELLPSLLVLAAVWLGLQLGKVGQE